ncbi:MAG: tRNA uridine-5-carboxymethylaminomethyl(34) synthesis GTPase MnmE, partial [Rhizobiaceae bacterium]
MPGSTIYALSSGQLPSGVAIIRVSGSECGIAVEYLLGGELHQRKASLRKLTHPTSNEVLDEVIALWFAGPASFTGEDVLEIQCHGGAATVSAILDALSTLHGFRLAEPGEFSRRAFENGRLDLTELEGLSDLISAQTEVQRRQAASQAGGGLSELYENWRSELIRIRSHMEAEIDFADEGDVNERAPETRGVKIQALLEAISSHLDDGNRGQIVRDGLKVVLAGPPNAGKSSLLNALAKRDIAIVTPYAGTTRDIVEVQLDIDGHLVTVSDTAGIRSTGDEIELAGIQKSHNAMKDADLVLWLQDIPGTKIPEAPANAVQV